MMQGLKEMVRGGRVHHEDAHLFLLCEFYDRNRYLAAFEVLEGAPLAISTGTVAGVACLASRQL